jgi:hypothetical protein
MTLQSDPTVMATMLCRYEIGKQSRPDKTPALSAQHSAASTQSTPLAPPAPVAEPVELDPVLLIAQLSSHQERIERLLHLLEDEDVNIFLPLLINSTPGASAVLRKIDEMAPLIDLVTNALSHPNVGDS